MGLILFLLPFLFINLLTFTTSERGELVKDSKFWLLFGTMVAILALIIVTG
jgi:hypothetical protein